jgi:hypothetical protein
MFATVRSICTPLHSVRYLASEVCRGRPSPTLAKAQNSARNHGRYLTLRTVRWRADAAAWLEYCPSAMRKELTPQQISSVPCPTCGVQPREKCQLNTGQPRNNPHRDCRLFAADKLNSRYSQAQTSRHISITSGLVKRVDFERIKARLIG